MDLPLKNNRNFLTINATDGLEVLKGLSSPVRINILKLLHSRGPLNVNEISDALSLPQSTVATNVQVLESCDLTRGDEIASDVVITGSCEIAGTGAGLQWRWPRSPYPYSFESDVKKPRGLA